MNCEVRLSLLPLRASYCLYLLLTAYYPLPTDSCVLAVDMLIGNV
jgi:hypothetical protein